MPCSWPTRRSASDRPNRRARTCRRPPSSRRRSSAAATRSIPGYGFLSEDDGFAEMTRAHDLAFIGPPAEVLERFASKAGTRELLGRHGLPTVPGSDGMLRDDEHALPRRSASATRCSSSRPPVAVARACDSCARRASFSRRSRSAARRRARRSATTRSTSRSGSRRHATSRSRSSSTASAPACTWASATARSSGGTRRSSRRGRARRIDDTTRVRLAEQALAAVVAAGYENVGTLEFLVDGDGRYFFIEINARIQVEHPVTEMLSGIDIVAEQIRIAAGEPLGYTQADVRLRGHADRVPHQRRGRACRLPAPGRGRRALRAARRARRPRREPPLQRLRGAAVLRFAPRQAHRLGSRPRYGHRALAGRARRVRRGRTGDQHPLPPGAARDETFLGGRFTTSLLDRKGAAAFLDAAGHDRENDERSTRCDPGSAPERAAARPGRSSASSRTAGRSCSSTASSRRTARAATSAPRRP